MDCYKAMYRILHCKTMHAFLFTVLHRVSKYNMTVVHCQSQVVQSPVVQSILSLMSSLGGQFVKCFTAL